MLSVLFMTVFSDPGPMVSTKDEKATLFMQAGLSNPAVASTRDGEDKTAQGYFDALADVKSAQPIEEVKLNDFRISHFMVKTGNALLKFWKNLENRSKTVLSCVIDLSSVGKQASDVQTAKDIKEDWLSYFWRLWSGKDETFKGAELTPDTLQKAKDFIDTKNNDGNGFTSFKGLIPRQWKGLRENEKEKARIDEIKKYVPTLLRVKKAGFDIKSIIGRFAEKISELSVNLPKETMDEFNNDDNDPAKPSTGHELNLEFWKIFYNDTLLELASGQLNKAESEQLVEESLEQVAELADKYKTRTS